MKKFLVQTVGQKKIHTDRPLQNYEQPDSDHVARADVAKSDLTISERHPEVKASQADHSVIIGRGSKRNTTILNIFLGGKFQAQQGEGNYFLNF